MVLQSDNSRNKLRKCNFNYTSFNANLTNGDCSSGQLVIGIQTNGTVLCATDATGSGGGGTKQVISGRGTASISADKWYHPTGGVLVAGDTDESQLMRLPYAGKLHNLSFIMNPVQALGDTCEGYVRYTSTWATSTANTILTCSINSDSFDYCMNTTASVDVAAESYIKFYVDEVGGTCVGIPSWSFVYEAT